MRYYLTAVRIAIINKSTRTSAGADVEKRKPFCTVGGNAIVAITVESIMELPPKIKNGSAV